MLQWKGVPCGECCAWEPGSPLTTVCTVCAEQSNDVTIRVGDTGTDADSICAAHLDASQAGPPPGVRKNVVCNGRYVRLESPQWLVASEVSALFSHLWGSGP